MDAGTLVQLLVATALVDQSAPPCWRMNELLGAVERLVMVTLGDCAGFAKIAGGALAELEERTVNPAVKVLLKLAVLNGRRRCDDEDSLSIQGLFDKVGEEINQLERGPRHDRCWSFFLYQQQVFGARCGFYAQASRAAEEAADLAATPHEVAISRYLARVYAMWASVVVGVPGEIATAFNSLKHQLPVLQNAVAGTALEVQWGMGNGPIHLLQAMILASIEDKELWDANMAVVLANEVALGGAFTPSSQVLQLENEFRHGQYDCVELGAHAILSDEKQSLSNKAWVQLIRARTHLRKGWDTARREYVLIQPVQDAHMVAAVAARELAQLTSK